MFTFVLKGRVAKKIEGSRDSAILVLGDIGETTFPRVRLLVRDRALWLSLDDRIQEDAIILVEGQIARVRTDRVGVDCFVFDFIGERIEYLGQWQPQWSRP